jgi:anthranilate/para-aminobenzoate synthase component II
MKEAQAPEAQLPLDSAPDANPNLSGFAPASSVAPARSPEQSANPNLSASPGPSHDSNPADRRADRLLAYLGLLEDAAPLFGSGLGHRAGGSVVGGSRSGAKRRH